tara:strand:- start:199 stop:609 length:411 start_codon:yes stop_codon:yes gene_type:complete
MQARILVVEDNDLNVHVLEAILENLNVAYDVTHNGEAAIEMAKKQLGEYDLIFMDLHMPGMNGFDATDAIRALESYKKNPVPIVALTANALMEEKSGFLRNTGLSDYLTKPFDEDDIVNVISKLCPEYRSSLRRAM